MQHVPYAQVVPCALVLVGPAVASRLLHVRSHQQGGPSEGTVGCSKILGRAVALTLIWTKTLTAAVALVWWADARMGDEQQQIAPGTVSASP